MEVAGPRLSIFRLPAASRITKHAHPRHVKDWAASLAPAGWRRSMDWGWVLVHRLGIVGWAPNGDLRPASPSATCLPAYTHQKVLLTCRGGSRSERNVASFAAQRTEPDGHRRYAWAREGKKKVGTRRKMERRRATASSHTEPNLTSSALQTPRSGVAPDGPDMAEMGEGTQRMEAFWKIPRLWPGIPSLLGLGCGLLMRGPRRDMHDDTTVTITSLEFSIFRLTDRTRCRTQ